ncbi:adenosylcobinamide-GDP ribazoletransferase [Falsiroseomonas sp.]|uniref:adenosylcobinamide-GDP ribazoletransferase n=1 Tax=Falsiroseomonas sp. TaxID=2870721 RepID=UPI0027364C9F|nr:adenosylcobinamide-GDP ribazoletransferase [Falsiroseomonas sp.]MDP3416533.1 adenosylcobinamide-GDP ribazoletransferase [Falsiroseomonas sp.]
MREWAQPAALALRFLSRLSPPGEEMARFERDLPRALACFPLAGALLGAITALVLWAAALVFPLYLAVLVALAFDAWLTRGLHEDAVADLVDGLGGGRAPEDVLRIMKNSQIGAFGALALGFAVALRAAGLVALEDPGRAVVALVVAGAASRLLMLAVMWRVPALPGLGARVAGAMDGRRFAQAVLLAAPVLLAGAWIAPGGMALALAAGLAFLAWYRALLLRRLGGSNGDAMGAAAYAGLVGTTLALAAW